MATGAAYVTTFRRKREGMTDYRKRLSLLKGRSPRVVVRKSLRHISMQIIEYSTQGDRVLTSAHTLELVKLGWKGGTDNISAAYLCGLMLAKKAKSKGRVIADLGMYPSVHGSKLYGALKGVVDGGLQLSLGKEVIPDESRLKGEHVAKYAAMLKETDAYKTRFSRYLKVGLAPEELPKHFEEIKKKVQG